MEDGPFNKNIDDGPSRHESRIESAYKYVGTPYNQSF